MDILGEEILLLWKALFENQVEYIMIGGFATNLHGFSRTTADADLWIKDTIENRKKLRKALSSTPIGYIEAIETMDFVPGWTGFTLFAGFELDIMTYIAGFSQANFDECYTLAPTATIEGVPVKFLHINHLIQAKEKAGRPKDLIDLIELKKLRGDKI